VGFTHSAAVERVDDNKVVTVWVLLLQHVCSCAAACVLWQSLLRLHCVSVPTGAEGAHKQNKHACLRKKHACTTRMLQQQRGGRQKPMHMCLHMCLQRALALPTETK
jgi:hypothetical protein